jgi:hypothetical protein
MSKNTQLVGFLPLFCLSRDFEYFTSSKLRRCQKNTPKLVCSTFKQYSYYSDHSKTKKFPRSFSSSFFAVSRKTRQYVNLPVYVEMPEYPNIPNRCQAAHSRLLLMLGYLQYHQQKSVIQLNCYCYRIL